MPHLIVVGYAIFANREIYSRFSQNVIMGECTHKLVTNLCKIVLYGLFRVYSDKIWTTFKKCL